MELLRATVKELIPGSLMFFSAGLAVSLPFLFGSPRAVRFGRRWLIALLLLYAVLSTQGASDLLMQGLGGRYHSIRTREEVDGVRIVVVLSNGVEPRRTDDQDLTVPNSETAFNVLEAARLYRLLGAPLLLASGGHSLQEDERGPPESQIVALALERLGVPAAAVVQESESRSTREQAVNVARWIHSHGETGFVLVTAPEHMRRALGAFAAVGLRPTPSPSPIQYGGRPFWLATAYAMSGSRSAIYEYLALAFYWQRGWL